MSRGRFYHDPARKHIEQYQDFSGGLNTMSANDDVLDSELTCLENIDLGERGSLKRRKGYTTTSSVYEDEGIAQGYWRFHRRYAPHNLIGIEGAFDGPIRYNSKGEERVGAWIAYNLHESEHVYKIEREEAANLTVNPNFEDGTGSDIPGWRINIPEESGNARIRRLTGSDGGDQVLAIEQYEGIKGYLGEYQEPIIPTMEGEEFYAEVMIRPLASGIPQKAHLGAYIFIDGEPNKYMYIHTEGKIGYNWEKLSGFFKMPKGATGVRFGLGISDYTNNRVMCHFDLFHVRKKASRTDNGAVAITSEILPDWNKWGGVGYNFDIEPNKHYLLLVDYKSDGEDARGAMEIYDRRFGLQSRQRVTWNDVAPEWTTKYMKFSTVTGFREARLNLYNRTLPDKAATVFYDSARIYEIPPELYDKIDKDPNYTGDSLVVQFPYRTGTLKSETITEEIVAKGGKFYINGEEKRVDGDIPIQSERPFDGVEYHSKMYFATGSAFLEYNGTKITRVEPYEPTPLETLYIGSNALSESPFEVYDVDGETITINQVKFSHRYGVINEFLTVEAAVKKPAGKDIEYKFERRRVTDKQDYWFTGSDWSDSNTYTFSTDIAGEYQFKISVREKGKTVKMDEYLVPKYIIKPTLDEGDEVVDAVSLHLCNRIIVHWDRLILYGDEIHPDVIYISDLQNPAYFPVNNTLWFQNPRKERITAIERYRDGLVVFTPTSIQALYGTNPENFERIMLNSSIGCIADRGAEVVKNHVVFPSYEGIALLKSIGMSETRANIEIIDDKVKNLVETDENAVAYVKDNQYCIVFPDHHKQLRFYYEWGVWSLDRSESIDFVDVIIEKGKLYALGKDGRVITESDDYNDEGNVFTSLIQTKYFNFDEPYAVKKTRQLQIMTDQLEEETNITVELDMEKLNVEGPEEITLVPEEEVYRHVAPGRGILVGLTIKHKEDKPFMLTGIGYVFKLKNP